LCPGKKNGVGPVNLDFYMRDRVQRGHGFARGKTPARCVSGRVFELLKNQATCKGELGKSEPGWVPGSPGVH